MWVPIRLSLMRRPLLILFHCCICFICCILCVRVLHLCYGHAYLHTQHTHTHTPYQPILVNFLIEPRGFRLLFGSSVELINYRIAIANISILLSYISFNFKLFVFTIDTMIQIRTTHTNYFIAFHNISFWRNVELLL